jgi:NAD(P)-dependent dehydrogenase (short-subunit alcohol dehydrogenase family)
MPTVLITGASRGLGLEFARQYAADGWRVHACCRRPERASDLAALAGDGAVTLHALDVSDFAAVDALARELRGTAIDVLINNAGLFGPKFQAENDPGQLFGTMDYDVWSRLLTVNTMAPLRMAEAFMAHVAASDERKIVAMSTSLASVERTDGRHYAYRSSKAALNMVMATLARDLAPRGVIVAVFCPGWVKTDMGGPSATVETTDSIRGLRRRIAELTPEGAGRFLRFDGEPVPW